MHSVTGLYFRILSLRHWATMAVVTMEEIAPEWQLLSAVLGKWRPIWTCYHVAWTATRALCSTKARCLAALKAISTFHRHRVPTKRPMIRHHHSISIHDRTIIRSLPSRFKMTRRCQKRPLGSTDNLRLTLCWRSSLTLTPPEIRHQLRNSMLLLRPRFILTAIKITIKFCRAGQRAATTTTKIIMMMMMRLLDKI